MSRKSKLTAPELERLARTPCPLASLVSSGISPFNSAFGALVFEDGGAGRAERARGFGPGIGFAHVDDPNCLDPRRGWFDAVRARLLPSLDAAPETLLA